MFSGDRLLKRRKELGLSQAQLSDSLGISRPSYFNWEKGKTQPNQKNLSLLADLLQVDPTYFEEGAEILQLYQQLTPSNQDRVLTYSKGVLQEQENGPTRLERPRFSYRVFEKLSAGTGFSYFDDGNFDTVFHDEQMDHDFASWIFGDSMNPVYLNGEVALIKQTGFDYDGGIYAVDWDGQTYIKKVFREKDGLRLVSLNHQYSDKFAPYDENPRIIGLIVGHFMPTEY
ncbi:S24 family peptidase [Streptococcus sp. DD13]|uniref:S24 family peptidase n=1 Tax=Streptococcus sp. DD13 TaxID=1777881 RepID=UPI0007961801|nr:helix-turn-helix transcriptional regulator [Streptococcus sp. DD13]KXT78856.1 Pleiotropic regulator [Streptococcus sp. DD13]